MLKVPTYNNYSNERKIALLDNSTVTFMMQLEEAGVQAEYLLLGYDAVFIPGWVVAEIEDSTYRTKYVETLYKKGYKLYLIEEESYSDLMNGAESHLYEIVKASVSLISVMVAYLKRYVEKEEKLDMEAYEDWIKEMYAKWPLGSETTTNGRIKKKNAGEISLTILSEIFAWFYGDVESITIYTQDADTYDYQRHAEERLQKVFKGKTPVSVTYRSNDSILYQMYKDEKVSLDEIFELRKDGKRVNYTIVREDKSVALVSQVLKNEEFKELLKDETVQVVF